VNLPLFTVEFGRSSLNDDSANQRSYAVGTTRRGRLLRWIGLCAAALLLAVATGCLGWLFAGGDPAAVQLPDWIGAVAPSASAASQDHPQLRITSLPDGAAVMLDGRRHGSTPVEVEVSRGTHTLVLSHPDAIDEQRQISVDVDMAIGVSMWLRRPNATLLKPVTLSDYRR